MDSLRNVNIGECNGACHNKFRRPTMEHERSLLWFPLNCIHVQYFVKRGQALSKLQNTRTPGGNKQLKCTFCLLWNLDGLGRRIFIRWIQNMTLSGKFRSKITERRWWYITMHFESSVKSMSKKKRFARPSRAFFISVHFFPVLGKSWTP